MVVHQQHRQLIPHALLLSLEESSRAPASLPCLVARPPALRQSIPRVPASPQARFPGDWFAAQNPCHDLLLPVLRRPSETSTAPTPLLPPNGGSHCSAPPAAPDTLALPRCPPLQTPLLISRSATPARFAALLPVDTNPARSPNPVRQA